MYLYPGVVVYTVMVILSIPKSVQRNTLDKMKAFYIVEYSLISYHSLVARVKDEVRVL